MPKITALLLSILLIAPICFSSSAHAASTNIPADATDYLSFPEDFYIDTDMINMPNEHTLFVDQPNHQLAMVDLQTRKLQWGRSYDYLYSYKTLPQSGKVVLIVRQQKQLQKIVLSADSGKVLSSYNYPSTLLQHLQKADGTRKEQTQISWSAPETGSPKEKLAVQVKDNVFIYQAPWKKPVQSFQLNLPQHHNYESLSLLKLEYQSDQLVAAYQGSSLMQTQYTFELLNTSSSSNRPHTVEMPWNVQSDVQLENNQAVIYTSGVGNNLLAMSGRTPYPIYARYDIATGKKRYEQMHTFDKLDLGKEWRTDYTQGQLFLQDDTEGKWYLYSRSGKPIWEMSKTSDQISYRFIRYDASNRTLYLLVEDLDRNFSIVKQPIL